MNTWRSPCLDTKAFTWALLTAMRRFRTSSHSFCCPGAPRVSYKSLTLSILYQWRASQHQPVEILAGSLALQHRERICPDGDPRSIDSSVAPGSVQPFLVEFVRRKLCIWDLTYVFARSLHPGSCSR